jgi:hypothetical protein
MSKQSEAKFEQGYQAKPIFPMCSNCINYRSNQEIVGNFGYVKETNIHCELGGFAVKKQGTCNKHTKSN